MLAKKLLSVGKGGGTGVYDENLTYDSTNISTQFPNSNNTNIDSTGNVLTATASDGEAISILKTQDEGQENFVGLNSEVVPFQGKYEFANISEATTVSDTKATDDHTTYVSASGTVNASSELGDTTAAWKAFDNSEPTAWYGVRYELTGDITYQFNTPKNIPKYTVKSYNDSTRMIKDWTILGSHTGSFNGEEVILDIVTNEMGWADYETRDFYILNNAPYSYYRLKINANNGSPDYSFICEIQYFEVEGGSTANTLVTSTPIQDGDNLVIVKDDDSVNEVVASGVVENVSQMLLEKGNVTALGTPRSIVISGNFAYVADYSFDGVFVVDISDPNNLSIVESLTGVNLNGAQYLALSQGVLYVASYISDSITAIDISDPNNIIELGSYSSTNISSPGGIVVSGSVAYIIDVTRDSITSIDISNPSSMTQLDDLVILNMENPYDCAISGNTIFVVSNVAGAITAVDISNASALTEISSHPLVSSCRGIAIKNNIAYVSSINDYVFSIDISDPSNMSTLDHLSGATVNAAARLLISGDVLYVVSFNDDKVISIDISNPSALAILDNYVSASIDGASYLATNDTYLFVASINNSQVTAIQITETSYQLDTTPTTQGEIPSKVYAVDSKAEFEIGGGFVEAEKSGDTWDITVTPILKTTRSYNDLIDATGSQTLQSKITLKATGDKMTELTASLMKGK